jgi:hypothetical protein
MWWIDKPEKKTFWVMKKMKSQDLGTYAGDHIQIFKFSVSAQTIFSSPSFVPVERIRCAYNKQLLRQGQKVLRIRHTSSYSATTFENRQRFEPWQGVQILFPVISSCGTNHSSSQYSLKWFKSLMITGNRNDATSTRLWYL